MTPSSLLPRRIASLLCAALFLLGPAARGAEIGFIEDYALAKDRARALAQLVPGTEDYYYFNALQRQVAGRYDEVGAFLGPWEKRFGRTARFEEIRTRQALLLYERSRRESLEALRRSLGLRFDHRPPRTDAAKDLPTALDGSTYARGRFLALARALPGLQGFTDRALRWLATQPLSPDLRYQLLRRLRRPDVPGVVRLVADELGRRGSRGFGSLPIHRQLLLPQLQELAQRRPDLLNQRAFVDAVLRKLHPNPDVAWEEDPAERRAYLDRLWGFVSRLGPVHNSLKAHVLYHRLAFDRSQGVLDRARFEAYLALPRAAAYVDRNYLRRGEHRRFRANLRADFRAATLLPPVGDDQPLVRAYLLELLRDERDPSAFRATLDDRYLAEVFAEAKLLSGRGDPEQLGSLLPPQRFQSLKDRVDIEFAPTTPQRFAGDEQVRLELDIKNVRTLFVKVFRLDVANYYREHRKEVDTDLDLDGLVPSVQRTFRYDAPPLRRVRRAFDFPELRDPGVYIIDFIGGGRSSRALIRKGALRVLETVGTAGHELRAYDEDDALQTKASAWCDGRRYDADERGVITIPFSAKNERRAVVVRSGARVSLASLAPRPEDYELRASFHVERESLVAGNLAEVAVRAGLYLGDEPVSLSLVEDPRLTVVSEFLDGVESRQEVPAFRLFEDRESTYRFRVPPGVVRLRFALSGRVQRLGRSAPAEVRDEGVAEVNLIDEQPRTQELLLVAAAGDYLLELRGKNGEPRPGQLVRMALYHEDVTEALRVEARTDPQGRIFLGTLDGIRELRADADRSVPLVQRFLAEGRTTPSVLQVRAGKPIRVPTVELRDASPAEVSLLEVSDQGLYVRDRHDAISGLDPAGVLSIDGLPRGDYELYFWRTGCSIRLRVGAGELRHAWILGERRELERRETPPLHLAPLSVADGRLRVQVLGATPQTRVHVFATHFLPNVFAHQGLARVRDRAPRAARRRAAPSVFASGREIGDEYRYVLERKFRKTYPGNMLERPGLLLTPWAVGDTETSTQAPRAGEAFEGAGAPSYKQGRGGGRVRGPEARYSSEPNLDFLADPALCLLNLEPDAAGRIELPLAKLGGRSFVQVVALDAQTTCARATSLPAKAPRLRDLRLRRVLDAEQPTCERRRVHLVPKGAKLAIDDLRSSSFEVYDSLRRVFELYRTLSGDGALDEFAFVLDWPRRSLAEKRALYSEHACHELDFFLFRKDPEFFAQVVRPYLANKLRKTFVDRYLLGEDLQAYLAPWAYERLNAAEKVLLAQRVPGEGPRTARHLAELLELVPPDAAELERRFAVALARGALEANGVAEYLRMNRAAADGYGAVDGPLAEEDGEAGMAFAADEAEEAAPPDEPPAARAPSPSKGTELRRKRGAARGRWRNARAEKKKLAELYRELDATKEWAESNYYRVRTADAGPELIPVDGFWLDYARHEPGTPFLSEHLAEPTSGFAAMMFALSVLDLPFESGKHRMQYGESSLTIAAASPLVVFERSVERADAASASSTILVTQQVFAGDEAEGEPATEELVAHTPYTCRVVVTNPTDEERTLDVLVQIPAGSLPLANSQRTRSARVVLPPYNTESLQYSFYFPAPLSAPHAPAQVAEDGQVVARAEARTWKVVATPSRVDTSSWDYVSQHGSDDEVLAYLEGHAVIGLDLGLIAHRLRAKPFFSRLIALLSRRHCYDDTVWSYGLYHDHVPAIREYLLHQPQVLESCGMWLRSPLLDVSPTEHAGYEHLEYSPLVNARAHPLGRRRQILNDRFHAQYHRFLRVLSYKPRLTAEDLLEATYYLLLQDRIEEAIAAFARIDPDAVSQRLQYDYASAYLAWTTGDLDRARGLCERYAAYPVDRWRNRFQALAGQIQELAGGAAEVHDQADATQRNTREAARDASFEVRIEGGRVLLEYQALKEVEVRYYPMDLELLFSRNPFVQNTGSRFSYVEPAARQRRVLPGDRSEVVVDLPEAFRKQNVLVEVRAAGRSRSAAHTPNDLSVYLHEPFGQLQVLRRGDRRPEVGAYVKVYARTKGGAIRFYKDGYTDRRGRFDYASLSTNALDGVEEFSILVVSDDHGAVVQRAAPPAR
ncbi:MAG: hypothetical protein D6731_01950 [Planctomycetota bacterium]|nr:MAG: hypothetical protein D6731_01950 [Planctomycetota bacterium]